MLMTLEVHVEWRGQTHRVGRLYTPKQGSAVSFEYESQWLRRPDAFAIDPGGLPLQAGAQHRASLFGAIADCGPDRWGRVLIERAVRKHVLTAKPYQDIDYVTALDDSSRQGALRFRLEGQEGFLATRCGKLPPLVQLRALLRAADAIHGESETDQDLRFLLGAGSPLGGARPKSAVSLDNGQLAIAKFPKPDDTRDIAAGEVLALKLAQQAGIHVAEHQLVPVGTKSVSVITRFDRDELGRISFVSAATLLALSPGERGAYTLLADGIRQYGDNVAADLRELWRRLVFSLLIGNYDDHFRNHGFLMRKPGRWALSPAYDINPVPEIDQGRMQKTAISEEQEESSVEGAMAVTARFGLKPTQAREILAEVLKAVSKWRSAGRQLRMKSATLDAYASAFENPLVTEACRLLQNPV
jgi:serine/threonine-protein kinase HipA